MAERSPPRRRRRFPLGLLGVVALVALVAAYLSDCLPGLGSGGELGVPKSDAPSSATKPASAPSKAEAGDGLTIVVQGDRCRRGRGEPEPCLALCAALDTAQAAEVEVVVEAVEGRHGTVEELRQCLREAGFTRVRVHSE